MSPFLQDHSGKYSKVTPSSSPGQGRTTPKKPFQSIALLHDAFLYKGGGERLVSLMARVLDADLYSGFFSTGSFDPRDLGFSGRMVALGRPVFQKGLRHLVLKWRFLTQARRLREYETVIFSGDCLEALSRLSPETRKIYYCHTPPRYLFDFRDRYLDLFPRWIRSGIRQIFDHLSARYIRQIRQCDLILTNSLNVQSRLTHFCGVTSEILYPPVDLDRFVPLQEGEILDLPKNLPYQGYFLSFARLSPPKRVEQILETFLRLPEYHLVCTYGANDPLKERLLALTKGVENIMMIESPDDPTLVRLIQGAIATIYIPIDEDFGMSPVESMACGTPVIGADEGGLRETIIDHQTGRLIGVSDLDSVIRETDLTVWTGMSDACIHRASEFSLEVFEKKIKTYSIPSSSSFSL